MTVKKYYDTAQICKNGHIINTSCQHHSEDSHQFCPYCGAETINECLKCGAKIIGIPYYNRPTMASVDEDFIGRSYTTDYVFSRVYNLPAFCPNCGFPYPWTKNFLDSADEMANMLDDLTDEQKEILKSTFPDLISETPKSKVQALKASKILNGCQSFGKEIFISFLKDHVVESLFTLMNLK